MQTEWAAAMTKKREVRQRKVEKKLAEREKRRRKRERRRRRNHSDLEEFEEILQWNARFAELDTGAAVIKASMNTIASPEGVAVVETTQTSKIAATILTRRDAFSDNNGKHFVSDADEGEIAKKLFCFHRRTARSAVANPSAMPQTLAIFMALHTLFPPWTLAERLAGCGCEETRMRFCRHENGENPGSCESCALHLDSTPCHSKGLSKLGARSCELFCVGGESATCCGDSYSFTPLLVPHP